MLLARSVMSLCQLLVNLALALSAGVTVVFCTNVCVAHCSVLCSRSCLIAGRCSASYICLMCFSHGVSVLLCMSIVILRVVLCLSGCRQVLQPLNTSVCCAGISFMATKIRREEEENELEPYVLTTACTPMLLLYSSLCRAFRIELLAARLTEQALKYRCLQRCVSHFSQASTPMQHPDVEIACAG